MIVVEKEKTVATEAETIAMETAVPAEQLLTVAPIPHHRQADEAEVEKPIIHPAQIQELEESAGQTDDAPLVEHLTEIASHMQEEGTSVSALDGGPLSVAQPENNVFVTELMNQETMNDDDPQELQGGNIVVTYIIHKFIIFLSRLIQPIF